MNPSPNLALYAAIITLSGTVFVAAVIVPWVQARTRRRERWETAVSELSALLAGELEGAFNRFTHEAAVERGVIAKLIEANKTRDEINSLTGDQWRARSEADEALRTSMRRLVELSDVVRTRKRSRAEWRQLFLLVEDFRFKVLMLTGPPNPQVDQTEAFFQLELEANRARRALIDFLKPIRVLMRLERPILDPLSRLSRQPLEWLLRPVVLLRGRVVRWLAGLEAQREKRRAQERSSSQERPSEGS